MLTAFLNAYILGVERSGFYTMRIWRNIFCISLAIYFFVPSTFAATVGTHAHNQSPSQEQEALLVSAWAKAEVDMSIELGFGPDGESYLPEHLSDPITRSSFAKYIARFIAFQQHFDCDALCGLIMYDKAEKNMWGLPKAPFSDTSGLHEVNSMYYIGVIEGRGDGTFDNNSNITRQEAATLLTRAYMAYGGAVPEASLLAEYSDAEEIDLWARSSVSFLSAAKIMNGYEDGRFAPNDLYSWEQCLSTLVRLYEKLPISRKSGNVDQLYSYDECMAYLEDQDQLAHQNNAGTFLKKVVEGSVATFVYLDSGGAPGATAQFEFVYRDGGMTSVHDFGVCNSGKGYFWSGVALENCGFSEDGNVFCCDIVLSRPVENHFLEEPGSAHEHEAGTYHIVMDVETLGYQVEKIK